MEIALCHEKLDRNSTNPATTDPNTTVSFARRRADGLILAYSDAVRQRLPSASVRGAGLLPRRAARFHRPGKPTDNSHIESLNGRLRDECLNVHQFLPIADAQAKIDAWRRDYNEVRPHGSLGDLTPAEFIKTRQERRTEKAASL